MALVFPSDPEVGDEYVGDNGVTYIWDGVKWAGQLTQGTSPGGGAIIQVQNEGIVISTATGIFNFIGAGVAVTSTNTTLVTVTIEAEPLTTATTATLGGVKIGSGVTITDGVISVREGLQHWIESLTVVDSSQTAIISLLVNGTQDNIDAVIKAQGSGAIRNDEDGNTRGAYAVDWQRIRGIDTQVASGDYSIISGGSFNRASGLHSIIVGGNNNTNNSAYSVILGGVNGNTRGIDGAVIMPQYATGGASNSSGKVQAGYYLLSGDTLQTTSPVDLTTDGSGNIAANNQITLRDNSLVQFKGTVVAKEINTDNTPEIAVWEIKGTAFRGVGNTTTDLVSVVNPILIDSTTSTSWQVSVSTENNIGCILLQVQGTAEQQIRWVVRLETIEVADAGV
jgi:hypothetical protein